MPRFPAAAPTSLVAQRLVQLLGPRLTLVEADLVPQDHHAFRQQLVLKGTEMLSQLRGCPGGSRWAGPPRV